MYVYVSLLTLSASACLLYEHFMRTCPVHDRLYITFFYVPRIHTHTYILMPRFSVTICTRGERLPEVTAETISRFKQPYRFSLPCAPDVAGAFLMALPKVRYHEKLPG